MGFSVKKKGEREYLYFYLGSEGPYYLAPNDNPKDSNIDNVLKALSYVSEKNQDFTQDEIKLIDMLPSLSKDQYVSKRLVELDKNLELTLKQSSETEQKEYLQRRVAAFQTSLRQVIQRIKELEEIKKHIKKIFEEFYSIHKSKPFFNDLVDNLVEGTFPHLKHLQKITKEAVREELNKLVKIKAEELKLEPKEVEWELLEVVAGLQMKSADRHRIEKLAQELKRKLK